MTSGILQECGQLGYKQGEPARRSHRLRFGFMAHTQFCSLEIVNAPCTPPTSVGAGSDRTSRHWQRQPRRLCCRRLPALARGDSRGLSYARRSLFKDAWPRPMAARGTAFVSAPGVRAYNTASGAGHCLRQCARGSRQKGGKFGVSSVTPAIVYSIFSPLKPQRRLKGVTTPRVAASGISKADPNPYTAGHLCWCGVLAQIRHWQRQSIQLCCRRLPSHARGELLMSRLRTAILVKGRLA